MPSFEPLFSSYYNNDEWRDWARSVSRKLDTIISLLTKQGEEVMATMQELVSKVSEETTVIGSAVVLLDGLTVAIADLKQRLIDAGMDAAAADALLSQMEANKQALADAVARNTPAEG